MNKTIKEYLIALVVMVIISIPIAIYGSIPFFVKLLFTWITLFSIVAADSLLCSFIAPKFSSPRFFSFIRFIIGICVGGMMYGIAYLINPVYAAESSHILGMAIGFIGARILFFPCGRK